MQHVRVLKQHPKVADRIRVIIIVAFVFSLGIMHGKDMAGLIGRAAGTVMSVQDEQAEKGRRAAEFYKDLDKMSDQTVREQALPAREENVEDRN